MSRQSLLLFLFSVGMLIQSCTTPPPKDEWENTYFPLKEFVQEHIDKLSENSVANVQKNIFYDGKQELIDDAINDWEKELEVYISADINKPVLKGAYSVEESVEDNLKIVMYRATQEDLEVKKITVRYAPTDTPRKIEIEQGTKNMLYETKRLLTLEFNEKTITHYGVEETQKLLLRKPVNYQLSASVLYE